ncbi:MAG: response regulator [Candidatus Eisenbacteria bacterium]|uniref:Response regulator n=1 Tax=Eiseniibacteriota bacterium TaxID=2212470 RepID=A0A933SDM1_UNCEI|nr:response regulator [Candidatus Eisenbacteria bacterium]
MKWTPPALPSHRSVAAPLVLVADDDPKVVELVHLALHAQHLRVVTAYDGDEAIRRALAERPDLVVLDARMPGKNGIEVCDWLRHDPEDPQVPVVLLADANDGDLKLEALARGADDVLTKPFSPRELVARTKRLLARSQELREQRRRAAQLERDLARAQDDARRAAADLRREQRLRELAFGFGRDLQRSLDPDDVAARVLAAAHRLLRCDDLALFAPAGGALDGRALQPFATAGEDAARFGGLTLDPRGELVALVSGLGRPVRRAELERFSAVAPELAEFGARGAALFVPVRTLAGIEAVLVAGERADGIAPSAADLEVLGALGQLAAPALQNAWRHRGAEDRAIELLAERAQANDRVRHAAAEASTLAEGACAWLDLPMRERALVAHAVALGAWAWNGDGHAALAALASHEDSGRLGELRELIGRAALLDVPAHLSAERREAALLVAVCVRITIARASGRSGGEAWSTAIGWASAQLDPRVHEALASAAEKREPERVRRPGSMSRAA